MPSDVDLTSKRHFDSTRCTGCKACELACKDYKELDANTLFRRVYDFEGSMWERGADGTFHTAAFVYHVSNSCDHCDNPACAVVCPVSSMVKKCRNAP